MECSYNEHSGGEALVRERSVPDEFPHFILDTGKKLGIELLDGLVENTRIDHEGGMDRSIADDL